MMKIDKGLLDEIAGVFIGAGLTLTFFSDQASVPARVGPPIVGLLAVPALLVGLHFEKNWHRIANHLIWVTITVVMAIVLISRAGADAVESFSLAIGIAFWAIIQEFLHLAEKSLT
jgi:hypothetical protein